MSQRYPGKAPKSLHLIGSKAYDGAVLFVDYRGVRGDVVPGSFSAVDVIAAIKRAAVTLGADPSPGCKRRCNTVYASLQSGGSVIALSHCLAEQRRAWLHRLKIGPARGHSPATAKPMRDVARAKGMTRSVILIRDKDPCEVCFWGGQCSERVLHLNNETMPTTSAKAGTPSQ